MAVRRVAVGAQVTILAVSCGGLFMVWIWKLSSISLTRTARTMIIDATCSAPESLQNCKEKEGAHARKGGEAKRRSSPHGGAQARERESVRPKAVAPPLGLRVKAESRCRACVREREGKPRGGEALTPA
jgi:hypothetical protein